MAFLQSQDTLESHQPLITYPQHSKTDSILSILFFFFYFGIMISKSLSCHLNPHPHHHHVFSNSKPNSIPLSISLSLSNAFNTIPSTLTTLKPLISTNKKPLLFTSMTSIQPNSIPEFKDFQPDPTLINDDLAPTKASERTFSGWEMASLWVGLVVGVPTYYLAGSLVDLGMAWWQGILTVVTANVITVIALGLTGHPGTRYGIPFPVLARSAFGIRGAHIPTLLRGLVACGWYGIETWIGGEAIFLLLPNSIKNSSIANSIPWLGTSPIEFGCFILFWVAQLIVVIKGMDGIRQLEKYSAPILIILTSCLLIWAYINAGGFGPILLMSSRLSEPEFWSLFFPSLTANVSFWATLALNIPDFTRYAKTQKDQIIGQAGLPILMGAFTFVGLAVTASTQVIFGRVISNPITLLGEIGGLGTMILSIFGITLATITTNIAANVVAPANALVNLSPSIFTFRKGAFLTALLGIVFQPWRLLKSSESFVYTWLVGYSALMGPITGIILADYYLVKGRNLDVNDLYTLNPVGNYFYCNGYNLGAIGALVIGILPVIPGFMQKIGILDSIPEFLVMIYNNAWFFGLFSSGIIYWIFSGLKRTNQVPSQPSDPFLPKNAV